MAKLTSEREIPCPCCGAVLTIDLNLGRVVIGFKVCNQAATPRRSPSIHLFGDSDGTSFSTATARALETPAIRSRTLTRLWVAPSL